MSALRSLSEGKEPQPAMLIRSALRLEPCLRKSAALRTSHPLAPAPGGRRPLLATVRAPSAQRGRPSASRAEGACPAVGRTLGRRRRRSGSGPTASRMSAGYTEGPRRHDDDQTRPPSQNGTGTPVLACFLTGDSHEERPSEGTFTERAPPKSEVRPTPRNRTSRILRVISGRRTNQLAKWPTQTEARPRRGRSSDGRIARSRQALPTLAAVQVRRSASACR